MTQETSSPQHLWSCKVVIFETDTFLWASVVDVVVVVALTLFLPDLHFFHYRLTLLVGAKSVQMCMFHSAVTEVFIVNGLKTTDVFVGEWATFSCQLSGQPPGGVQWWLDGTVLDNSPVSELGLSQGHVYTLTLKNVATDDSGTVTFKAGNLTSTAKLLVKGTMAQIIFK